MVGSSSRTIVVLRIIIIGALLFGGLLFVFGIFDDWTVETVAILKMFGLYILRISLAVLYVGFIIAMGFTVLKTITKLHRISAIISTLVFFSYGSAIANQSVMQIPEEITFFVWIFNSLVILPLLLVCSVMFVINGDIVAGVQNGFRMYRKFVGTVFTLLFPFFSDSNNNDTARLVRQLKKTGRI